MFLLQSGYCKINRNHEIIVFKLRLSEGNSLILRRFYKNIVLYHGLVTKSII